MSSGSIRAKRKRERSAFDRAEAVRVDTRQLALDLAQALKGPSPIREPLRELALRLLPGLMARLARPSDLEIAWRLHLLPSLGAETQDTLTRARVESVLEGLNCSSRTFNKTRQQGALLLDRAREEGLWGDTNPFRLVRQRREVRREIRVLQPWEFVRVLGTLPSRLRALFATSYLMGARKGELRKWRRADADMDRGLLVFRGTKNGDDRKLPINSSLLPLLAEHLANHKSEWVFPGPNGAQMSPWAKLEERFRSALGRAGFIDAFDHLCRRCERSERHRDGHQRRCDACGMLLWIRLVPPRMRFHDLRHMATTLLQERGVPRGVVKLIVGHRTRDITDLYTHHTEKFMQRMINKLSLAESAPPFDSAHDLRPSKPRVAGSSPAGRAFQVLPIKGLHTPQQVAAILGVKRDTVYKLIHEGPLVAYRIGSSLRVHTDDLDTFLAKSKFRRVKKK